MEWYLTLTGVILEEYVEIMKKWENEWKKVSKCKKKKLDISLSSGYSKV